MISPRAMARDGEGSRAEPRKGGAASIASAPTRCPSAELLAFGDTADADAREGSRGGSVLPEGGDETVLLERALRAAPQSLPAPQTTRRVPAAPAPRGAPPRRLRSEAYWEQQRAAAALRPRCSPWEVGARERRQAAEEGRREPAAAAAPAAPAAGGAAGVPRGWAGAAARGLRRGALRPAAPAAPPAMPPRSPSAARRAALRSQGRWYHPA
ncbi:unnamed protein product [Prorocentrum cordatum]|uniref:Uncharacterized protein n=1 Tax=Prorocentrum cordatum TaxID=2364126 RepID=A0ABN9SY06_9DINO|nr:unnamed protein product [Polarella glacialis]